MHWDVSRLVGGRRSDVGVEVGKARRSVGHFSVDGTDWGVHVLGVISGLSRYYTLGMLRVL